MKVRVKDLPVAPHDSGGRNSAAKAQRRRWSELRGQVLEVEPDPVTCEHRCTGKGYALTPEQVAALGLRQGQWLVCEHDVDVETPRELP